MTIHNQLLSDTMTLDLSALIKKYGSPHFPTKRNPVGTLNEVFWSAFFATLNEFSTRIEKASSTATAARFTTQPASICFASSLPMTFCERLRSGLDTWPCRNYATQDILAVFLPISRV